jgi:hypothetical protein
MEHDLPEFNNTAIVGHDVDKIENTLDNYFQPRFNDNGLVLRRLPIFFQIQTVYDDLAELSSDVRRQNYNYITNRDVLKANPEKYLCEDEGIRFHTRELEYLFSDCSTLIKRIEVIFSSLETTVRDAYKNELQERPDLDERCIEPLIHIMLSIAYNVRTACFNTQKNIVDLLNQMEQHIYKCSSTIGVPYTTPHYKKPGPEDGHIMIGSGLPDRGIEWHMGFNRRSR